MRIIVPRIVQRIELRDYAPEMDGACIEVWVNQTRERRQEIVRLFGIMMGLGERIKALSPADTEYLRGVTEIEQRSRELHAWFAETWSQGADPANHWTVEEILELIGATRETDPQLWYWMVNETMRAIQRHQSGVKKN